MKYKTKCDCCGKLLFTIVKPKEGASHIGDGKRYCRSCGMLKVWELDKRQDGKRKKPIGYCMDCGKRIRYKERKRCQKCFLKVLNSGDRLTNKNHKKGCKCVKCYKRVGKECYNWIDGRSYEPYNKDFNNELRQKIRTRDLFVCQKCNITEEEHLTVYGKNLALHHIDYNKKNNNESNLITLCIECNARVNYNRDYWQNHFKEAVNGKILQNV